MAKTDILCLRRRELLQMINGCGFGPVLTIQQLRYYCDNNDVRGTDGRGVSLLRYAALLARPNSIRRSKRWTSGSS